MIHPEQLDAMIIHAEHAISHLELHEGDVFISKATRIREFRQMIQLEQELKRVMAERDILLQAGATLAGVAIGHN